MCCEHRDGLLLLFASTAVTSLLTIAVQLHAHLHAMLALRPWMTLNVVYLPRVLFPLDGGPPLTPTPCMLTDEVSLALKGIATQIRAV